MIKPVLPLQWELVDTIHSDIGVTYDANLTELSDKEVDWINNRVNQPTIKDYLDANKDLIDKTQCKVVSISSLIKFMEGE